eukprot:jgi/Tetstr1/447863/TSEL_035173.t1
MKAYIADMEAARREAPAADIEWPELDGHHGIAVLNVPLGSPEYVQAYMRGKAEELREEVDASLSKLLSAKPIRRGLFDPSTYGTDTNPVVTDFLAELLHDRDPMAAELGSVLGRGSFNATSSARQNDHFLNNAHGSDSYAAEMRVADAASLAILATQMRAKWSGKERTLFNQLDSASSMWTVAIPTARTAMTPHELREVAAGYFLLPSPCLAPVVGNQIILPSTAHNPDTVDLYGDALMNLPAPGDAHWRVQHDAIADAFRDHCVHDLGIAVRREVDDLFQQAVPLGNTVPMDELKDLVPDA